MTDATKYDVFLSFRGEDTRYTITDHLYEALVRSALTTFRDNDEIDRGQELKPEIDRAIKASEASVIVFSKNYATSTWCLEELSLILEQRSENNHFVLPVFYHVDPSDVRNQNNSFSIEAKSSHTSTRWTDENVKRWKTALTKAAKLTGLVLSGSETKFVKGIVDIIYNKLASKKFHLPLNLVKMDTRYEKINSWIKQSDSNFLVICGMGGSGKTTLAMYTVYSNRDNFENISIVEHISSQWKEPHHLHDLQETLLGGVLGNEKKKVLSCSQGKVLIQEALQKNKALIVLDDIVNHAQLVDLLGMGIINKESKIIITTRETNVSEWAEFKHGRCTVYQMKLLDDSEALELFSLHAFGSKNPIEDYKKLAQEVVLYCNGNPLAIEVLGSSLSNNISIPDWKSELDKIKRDTHLGIHNVLVRSYELLQYEYEKELFLHIACFFNGANVDHVVKIFERDCSAVSSIKTLIKRCLLSISPDRTLMMHPLLQKMGRSIVDQESPKDPAKRSRVWQSIESHDLLRKGTGSKKVEGLALDNQELTDNNPFQGSNLETDSFKGMLNLKLLYLKYVQLKDGPYKHFSKDLRWLRWIGFHLSTIPSDLFMGNLVTLDMSDSSLGEFEPPTVYLQSLKILNFKDSKKLLRIFNINKIPNLETLVLWNCHKLVYVCETIGGLKSLALINMTGCENLLKNNNSFPMPCSLERLFLKDCKLEYTDNFHLNFSDESSMQYLNLGNNLFKFLPSNNHLGNLRVLDLTNCSLLKELVSLPCTLAELYISYCASLEKVTFKSRRFTLQNFVCEGCTSLSEVEGFIKLVPIAKLDESDLGHLKWLKEYQDVEMRLVGGDALTKNKSQRVQVLYEFGIISTSLPEVTIPKMIPEGISEKTSTSLSFEVPQCLDSRRLKGLNVTFKYTVKDYECAWFAKISKKGVDLMYNPTVSGIPSLGEACIWLSYWPIGSNMHVADKITVSIVVVRGLEVSECGASLVYTDNEVADENFEDNMGWVETLNGDLSAFQLRERAYYLCRRDFFDKMEVDKRTPRWFMILVGHNIDHAVTVVQGWGKTGRPKQSNSSHGSKSKESYKNEEMSRSSFDDTNVEAMQSGTTFPDEKKKMKDEGPAYIISHIRRRSPKLYDVFLSIEAEDTLNAFTDHLNNALLRAEISTFRYANQIDSGEELNPVTDRAIKHSRTSIIVLSENYATSPWCLDELALILDERREFGHFVLPIFYHVNPFDVKKKRNKFKIEVKSSTRWTEYNVNRWKAALTEITNLNGMVINSGSEAQYIKHIVDIVYHEVTRKQLYLPGMDVPVKEINFWFEKPDAEVLTICGMVGSGKTTLARYIFNLLEHNFENVSFLEDIGRCSESDLRQVQQKLVRDILRDAKIKEHSVDDGMLEFQEVIQRKKVLIVLDDIVEVDQLVYLLGTGNINKGSKIIITTSDASVKTRIGSSSWRGQEYKMKLLDDGDALELFSLHAFRSRTPMEGYEEFAKEVVRFYEGIPLALVVSGSFLYGKNTKQWDCHLRWYLGKWVAYDIYKVFRSSYQSLPTDFEKDLFLDIAYFFIGEEIDYVTKILGHDNCVVSGINTLINKHLLSVSPNKKLTMHRLHQRMGRNIVYDESCFYPSKCSRFWCDNDSYRVLANWRDEDLHRIKGLVLDMRKLTQGENWYASQSSEFMTNAFKKMDKLELLQLKFVPLIASCKSFPKRLRYLSWHGFDSSVMPSELYMGNMVAIDMSYSKLEEFEPPTILQSLRILNLKDSHHLLEVRNIYLLPNLETLILSCCHKLVHVCETVGALANLSQLNMKSCRKVVTKWQRRSFSLPHLLKSLFFKDCNIENTYFPLSLSGQSLLQYLNLGNNSFELLPSYSHLVSLRVLDLTMCSELKSLLSLPSTLTELYINHCKSLEKVTSEAHRFTLKEFGCKGCINLSEVGGFFKLEPVAKLEGSYLGHMKWLKEYQHNEVCLVDNCQLAIGRSRVQMLYEFGIMSTSLLDKKDLNIAQYTSESSSLCFDVPQYPKNRRLKGLNVTFKYTIFGDNSVWFVKVSTTKGVDLMYNPTVFGKPGTGEVGMWFSYWPIGSNIETGDTITVSIIVISGLVVIECGASLVYTYEPIETLEYNMGWEETIGGDLSGFQLSTGAYYLCRRDLFKSMEVGRLAPDWFRMLVGDTVDETELQGWKISGRPKQENPLLTELN